LVTIGSVAGWLAIAIAFVIMMTRHWGVWCDIQVDFGRELYVPWRLTEGQVLYRDLAVFYGPLSQYLNAMWFRLFGVSLHTLVLCNAAILVLLIFLLHRMLTRIGGTLSAAAGCIVFVLLFAFGQGVIVNYNYLAPYSHEAVHGLVLSIGACLLFAKGLEQPRRLGWFAACGLCVGATFLTKPESFLALACALTGASILIACARSSARVPRFGRVLLLIAACAFVPIVVALGLLWTAMPLEQAGRGVLGSWPFLLNRDLLSLPFFRSGMGFDQPVASAMNLSMAIGWASALLIPAALLAMFVSNSPWQRRSVAAGAFLVCAAAFWITRESNAWFLLPRMLPVVAILVAAWATILIVKNSRGGEFPLRAVTWFMFATLAGVLLLKMLLNTRLTHYGFTLAMPATMLLTALLLDIIPQGLQKAGGSALVFRVAAAAAIGGACLIYLHTNEWGLALKDRSLDLDGDRFRTDLRIDFMAPILDFLRHNVRDGETVVCLPEGIMLNYLARRPTGIPYMTFLPSDMIMFDEHRMLQSLQQHPPDFIVLIPRDTSEYGPALFGRDYAQSFQQWMWSGYHQVFQTGDSRQQPQSAYVLTILRRGR
jgi:hypothetical protein